MVHNIATLSKSMFEATTLPCKSDVFYNAFKPIKNLTHTYDTPVGMFVFPDINDDARDELKAHGLSEFPSRRNAFIGTPNPTVLSYVFSLHPIQTRGDTGYVSSDSYLAFVYAIKGSQIFSTASRAAVMSASSNSLCSNVEAIDFLEKGSRTIGITKMGGSTEVEKMVEGLKSDTVFICRDSPIAVFSGILGHTTYSGYFASAAGALSIPNKHKLFFGYFEGMVLPDKSTFSHVFSKLFFHSLADDVDKAQQMWRRIRAGYRSMAYTESGKIISHIYFGMNLAIEAQASFTPVVEGNRYSGFILEAQGLSVFMNSQKFQGYDEQGVIEALRSLNQHEEALRQIVKLLGVPEKSGHMGDSVYNYTVGDIDTSRKLRNVLYKLDTGLFGSDFQKELSIQVEKLQFSEAFDPPKPKDIETFLQFVLTDNLSLLQNYPAYLRSGMCLKQSRVAMGLSIFGGRVPSISYGGDKEGPRIFNLLHGDDDPNLKKDPKGKRAVPFLPFCSVGAAQGLTQWEIMFKSGSFRVPQPRKGKAESFTNNTLVSLKVTDAQHFTDIYALMKTIAKEEQKAKAGGKRSREDDAVRGTVKKAKRGVEGIAGDI